MSFPDLQREDLRQGQPQQLRRRRGGGDRVQHHDGLQRPGEVCRKNI